MLARARVVAVLAVASCGFAPAPYDAGRVGRVPAPAVFQDSVAPTSYQAPSGKDVGRAIPATKVTAEACQEGLWIPLFASSFAIAVWGDGGFEKAMADAQAMAPGRRLFDVRADRHTTAYLGLYRAECVEVHASVVP